MQHAAVRARAETHLVNEVAVEKIRVSAESQERVNCCTGTAHTTKRAGIPSERGCMASRERDDVQREKGLTERVCCSRCEGSEQGDERDENNYSTAIEHTQREGQHARGECEQEGARVQVLRESGVCESVTDCYCFLLIADRSREARERREDTERERYLCTEARGQHARAV